MPEDLNDEMAAEEAQAARGKGTAARSDADPADPAEFWGDSQFPIVGLGGSAGSIEALSSFFRRTPEATGMAFVVILHLSPEHDSSLPEILQRSTKMPVLQVSSMVKIAPDHVYVIPPGKNLTMRDGSIDLVDLERPHGKRVAVDHFFRTLADTHGAGASAIVLSGLDGDGALGLKRIKERGGLTIAQDPEEAAEAGMPRAAIATGIVDWVLPVEEMPRRLIDYRENAKRLKLPPVDVPLPGDAEQAARRQSVQKRDEAALQEVLSFLRMRMGHDFSYYKRATILRRVGRRMQVNGCEDTSSYLDYLRTHIGEAGALLQDLLISVTNFFRDREGFEALEAMLPDLFKGKSPGDQVRVWVAACATGEEAYSIAMLLTEYASRLSSPPQIQIFATDIDELAIETARTGIYPESIATDVSEERLRRFFTRQSGGYQVKRSVREIVLFALHDLLKDSPFSRLDLISCRNLLIYLDRDAQGRVFDIFHFALVPEGKLYLGFSESAEDATALFIPLDKKNRIYSRRPTLRSGLTVPLGSPPLTLTLRAPHRPENGPVLPLAGSPANFANLPSAPGAQIRSFGRGSGRGDSLVELHFKLLDRFALPSVVVDRSYNIVHLSQGAGAFLQFAAGEPTADLLRMVHPMLRADLRTTLYRAGKSHGAEKSTGVPFEAGGISRLVDIAVYPADEVAADMLLVIFRPRGNDERAPARPAQSADTSAVVQQLEEELDHVKLHWQETVEQFETSTEELKASNEELQAMNEELRSTTEELETGREELQSINEELITVNSELKGKVEELSRTNSDLQNLMASTNIATVFLDLELRVKLYTPSTVLLFNLIPGDIGRPIAHLTHKFDYPRMVKDAEAVLETQAPVEREVRTLDGGWFLVRLLPYRTKEDEVVGVVLTCVEITERKRGEDARRWLSALVESSNDAIFSFSLATGEIISWNKGAERIFGFTADEMVGCSQIVAPPEYEDEKKAMLERLAKGEAIHSFETVRLRKDGSRINVSMSASVMRNDSGEILGATAIAQDITVRKQAVEELRQARDELEDRVEQRTHELQERADQLKRMATELTRSEQRERLKMSRLLHDHVQQLLVSAKMRLEGLARSGEAAAPKDLAAVVALLEETLESSRTLAVDLSPPVLNEGLAFALEWLGGVWMKDKHDLEVKLNLDHSLDAEGEELRALVFMSVREILFNVVKHAEVKEAFVDLYLEDPKHVNVKVRDHGRGFDLALLEAARSASPGMGLSRIRERLQMLGGTLQIVSGAGEGVEAVITVPRGPDVVPK